MKMPEITKVEAVREQSQLIGEFIDSMKSKGIVFCKYEKREIVCGIKECGCRYGIKSTNCKGKHHQHDDLRYNWEHTRHQLIRKNIEQLLADYFNIDLNKVEKEKVKLLESIRAKK